MDWREIPPGLTISTSRPTALPWTPLPRTILPSTTLPGIALPKTKTMLP